MFCPNCGKENDPSVRHCKSCGSFIPDFSSAESSGTNDALNFSETSDAPQPMTFENLSQDDIKDLNNNTSRYQEYTMSDVVAKKSRKKLIIAIIAIAAVIGLGVASFFIIRSIISGNTVKSIQEDPTKYVFDSYRATAESMTANNAVVKSATASTNEQKTVKTTISYNDSSQSTIYSVDALAKKFYYRIERSQKISDEMKKYYSGPENITTEFFSDMDKAVAKFSFDNESYDYYINLDNLREEAAYSAFGPKGENIFNIDQKTFDIAMDVYDFIYNNLKNDSDPFGIVTLANKLKDDFDKCGNVSVANENVDIDGTKTDAYVISHTFNNTDIVTSLLTDVKDWIKNSIVNNIIDDEVNAAVDKGLSQIDVSQIAAQINSSVKNFEIVFKHYVNKDNALMQAEILANVNGQGIKLTLTFGADPASSKKITIKASTQGGAAESVLQTITVTNESTAAQDKFVATYTGMLLTGSTTYTRDTATGDFTITNNMNNPMKALSAGQGQTVPAQDQAPNMSISGNMKLTDDSMTITYTEPAYDGTEMKFEYYISGKAEINELSSNNNLLTTKSSDLKKMFGSIGIPAKY